MLDRALAETGMWSLRAGCALAYAACLTDLPTSILIG
jgi:hypothetical protein